MLTNRQQHCLQGIGIRQWRKREAVSGAAATEPSAPVVFADDEIEAINRFIEPTGADAATDAGDTGDRPRFSGEDLQRVDSYSEKRGLSPVSAVSEVAQPAPPALDTWDGLIAAIQACRACELADHCTQKVAGVGDRRAALLIVGEGPGHDEDIQGEPFVGRSGQLLNRMLAAIGIAREQVYITNIVKCRPPNNRDPKPEEARQCRAYLEAQIKQIAPRVILSVGRVSAHNLLGSSEPVGKLIKQMHKLPGTEIPVKVTYHPAYLLRNPSAKAVAWQDLKRLHRMLQ